MARNARAGKNKTKKNHKLYKLKLIPLRKVHFEVKCDVDRKNIDESNAFK